MYWYRVEEDFAVIFTCPCLTGILTLVCSEMLFNNVGQNTRCYMMTSYNGNTLGTTRPVWREYTSHRLIPSQMTILRDFGVFVVAWISCGTCSRVAGDFRHRITFRNVIVNVVDMNITVLFLDTYGTKMWHLLERKNPCSPTCMSFSRSSPRWVAATLGSRSDDVTMKRAPESRSCLCNSSVRDSNKCILDISRSLLCMYSY